MPISNPSLWFSNFFSFWFGLWCTLIRSSFFHQIWFLEYSFGCDWWISYWISGLFFVMIRSTKAEHESIRKHKYWLQNLHSKTDPEQFQIMLRKNFISEFGSGFSWSPLALKRSEIESSDKIVLKQSLWDNWHKTVTKVKFKVWESLSLSSQLLIIATITLNDFCHWKWSKCVIRVSLTMDKYQKRPQNWVLSSLICIEIEKKSSIFDGSAQTLKKTIFPKKKYFFIKISN